MSDLARPNLGERDEFWRPPADASVVEAVAPRTLVCDECGADYVVGSRFCHVCGAERDPQVARRPALDLSRIKSALGLPVGSLIAFLAGIVCLIGALSVGLMFKAVTVLDWQAIQLWRIQWLLAAVAAFAAGILLKKSS